MNSHILNSSCGRHLSVHVINRNTICFREKEKKEKIDNVQQQERETRSSLRKARPKCNKWHNCNAVMVLWHHACRRSRFTAHRDDTSWADVFAAIFSETEHIVISRQAHKYTGWTEAERCSDVNKHYFAWMGWARIHRRLKRRARCAVDHSNLIFWMSKNLHVRIAVTSHDSTLQIFVQIIACSLSLSLSLHHSTFRRSARGAFSIYFFFF